MKKNIKSKMLSFLRVLPLIVCLLFIIWFLFNKNDITVSTILKAVPQNSYAAAIVLLLLYAVKSISIVFPIIILQIAGGFLFPPFIAIIVNILGSVVELTLPYWIGRISGQNHAQRLCLKYPKLSEIIEYQTGNGFFQSFFLHIISCLPGDVVNMYMGAVKVPYIKYILGSLLGVLPGILTATIMGTSVTEPTSPAFWVSAIITVMISVASVLIYYIWRKNKTKK